MYKLYFAMAAATQAYEVTKQQRRN